MKVIFITRENSKMPAVRVRCHNFAKHLEKAGIKTEIFSYADVLGAKSGKEEMNMTWAQKCLYNLRAYLRLSSEDAVLILQRFNYHSFAPLLLKMLNKNKLVFDLDDWEARENIRYYFNRIPNSKAEIMMRFIARRSDLCIGASRFLFKYLCCYNNKVLYMPTAVDTDFFKPVIEEKKNKDIVLSWIGTIHRKDNVENIGFLIECFKTVNAAYPKTRLEIRGDGIFYETVNDLVNNCGNSNISLKPWIDPENIPEYLQEIDIGIMPLIQDTKFNKAKSPTRLFEYMAMAKPVVASCIGETKEIIDSGVNGLLADTKEDFVKSMKFLIENGNIRKTLGENSRKTIEDKFSLKKVAGELVEKIRIL
ncbi:MAG: glycosyltransferase [Candidatus Omnitrophica bacterium]|nr:glycosyltransferase [Candidatus Omnitrophota bacterium]